MICRDCRKVFDANRSRVCPSCGAANPVVTSGVLRTSTIRISSGGTDAVYRTVKEVPPPLRRQLLKSTNGINAATILIADRRGRAEIARALRKLPAPIEQRLFQAIFGGEPAVQPSPAARGFSWKWLGGILLAASVGFIWLVFTHGWF